MTEILPRPMLLEEFSGLVGHKFVADCTPEPVAITLIEASPLRPNEAAERPPFILIFHTPPEVLLVEGAYTLKCGEWGPDMIHIWQTNAPAKGAPGHYYQAVFN